MISGFSSLSKPILKMGHIRHHMIVVTSWDQGLLEEAKVTARRIFHREFFPNYRDADNLVSETIDSLTNGYSTFFIAPDGSKEGWSESEDGDCARKCFIEWLKTKQHEDGSSALRYAEIFYGDDDRQSEIITHN